MSDKPHLSPSQLDMMARCGESYRRRYICGEVIPPGLAAARGSGVHRGAEINFRQKVESFDNLPTDDIVEAAVEGFKADVERRGYRLSKDELSKGPKAAIADATDQTAALAAVHAEFQAPKWQPVLVEQTIRLNLPRRTHDLLAVVDCAGFPVGMEPGTPSTVVDIKTSGRRKPQSEADRSVQLTTYAAALKVAENREDDIAVVLEVCVNNEKPVAQTLTSSRGTADFAALSRRINAALRVIESGDFMPAPVGAWNCSPEWCGYWDTCPYVNSERKEAANG